MKNSTKGICLSLAAFAALGIGGYVAAAPGLIIAPGAGQCQVTCKNVSYAYDGTSPYLGFELLECFPCATGGCVPNAIPPQNMCAPQGVNITVTFYNNGSINCSTVTGPGTIEAATVSAPQFSFQSGWDFCLGG